jgi:large subunit ribosomal protein L24
MKFYYVGALHRKSKNLAGHLSEKLRKELKRRSLAIKKGDTVKVMRGSFAGKEGKVIEVERAGGRIFVEKVIRKKSDGAEVKVGIDASKVMITDIDRTDRKRFKARGKEKKSDKK